jgi:hypothetical protein
VLACTRARINLNVDMSTSPFPHLTDSEIQQLFERAKQKERTAVISGRVSLAARDSVRALARAQGTTPSRLIGSLLTTLADSDSIQPSRDQLATLEKVCAALGISADSDAPTIKSALIALLEAAAPPEPSDADPLQSTPDPPPAQLSHTASSKTPAGAKPDAYGFTPNPAAAFPTTPAQQKKWVSDRAAQRAKRAAKRLAPGKIAGR